MPVVKTVWVKNNRFLAHLEQRCLSSGAFNISYIVHFFTEAYIKYIYIKDHALFELELRKFAVICVMPNIVQIQVSSNLDPCTNAWKQIGVRTEIYF